MKRIYLDHNATTPLNPEVLEAMLPYLREVYGNPASTHLFGQEAKRGIEEAREKIARLLCASPVEIVFTSGGTEADNLAVKGAAYANREKGRHIITSSIEHQAVLNPCRHLEKEGFRVVYLPVDRYGMIDPDDLRRAVTAETILITLMHSNNEVGTIQPIAEIGRIAAERGILFHTDAIQSVGKIPVDVKRLGVDLLSISAHKMYGPKGVGALFIRKGVRIDPLLHGGHHELNRRAGTENVAGIVGFGKAAEIVFVEMEGSGVAIRALRDYFWGRIQEKIDHVHLNGHPEKRLPNTLNLAFEFIAGEAMVINLDLHGVAASTGSACTSGASEPSHVLLSMGLPGRMTQGAVRFSLGKDTTKEEINETVEVLAETVNRLRSGSPFYADFMAGRR
jgi:cysteine desulfurase